VDHACRLCINNSQIIIEIKNFILFVRISSDVTALSSLLSVLSDVKPRLESRAKLAPAEFVSTLATREKVGYGKSGCIIEKHIAGLFVQ
jgi:hypothetical protein